MVKLWRASTLGHDFKLLIENLSDHWHPWAWSQKINGRPIIEVWENLHNYILRYLEMENWFIIQNFFGLSWAVHEYIDVEAWRSLHWENGFLAKTKMMNSSDSNPWAKSRSRGEVKWNDTFGSPSFCVPFLVWLGQGWLFNQKDASLQESSP
jgi:hypothetical protein